MGSHTMKKGTLVDFKGSSPLLGSRQGWIIVQMKSLDLSLSHACGHGSLKDHNSAVQIKNVKLFDHLVSARFEEFSRLPLGLTLEERYPRIE